MDIYSIDDYQNLWGRTFNLTPQKFGCKDWHHNPDGKVNYWSWVRTYSNTESYRDAPKPSETAYDYEKDEFYENTQRDNLSCGWDRMRKYGELMDYWKIYEEYN